MNHTPQAAAKRIREPRAISCHGHPNTCTDNPGAEKGVGTAARPAAEDAEAHGGRRASAQPRHSPPAPGTRGPARPRCPVHAAAVSGADGRARATNEQRPWQPAQPIGAAPEGKGRAPRRLALGRGSAALARLEGRGARAGARRAAGGAARLVAGDRRLPPRGARPEAKARRRAVRGARRSELLGAPPRSVGGALGSTPARSCAAGASPRGDPGSEEEIPAADCCQHCSLPPLLRLTFKPRQNGAAARLRSERMRERSRAEGAGPARGRVLPGANGQWGPRAASADVTGDNACRPNRFPHFANLRPAPIGDLLGCHGLANSRSSVTVEGQEASHVGSVSGQREFPPAQSCCLTESKGTVQ